MNQFAKVLFLLSLLLKLITCHVTPPSEPFILAAYDPDYDTETNHILHSNLEKVSYNGTKVLLCDRYDESENYLEGRVLSNSSYKVDNLKGMFIRVDKFTHRLKLCPSGESSCDFSIKKGMLYHKNDQTWTVCYDEEEDASYIYKGTAKDNKRYCCDENSHSIVLKAIGKYDTSGAIPNYPQNDNIEW